MTDSERGWWRMLDANLNRCGEGLRVVEDWCRFVADDKVLSETTKQLRHDLHNLSQAWPWQSRLAARNVTDDVGREITTPSETTRENALSVLQANLYRVQQSLRVMEEATKLLRLASSAAVEALRYRCYDLQRQLLLAAAADSNPTAAPQSHEKAPSERHHRLEQATVYVLTDAVGTLEEYQRHIQALVAAGVDVVQLRDKRLSDRQLWEYAQWTAAALAATPVLFIVNDRADIAVAVGADGVHVGQDELPVEVVRAIVGPERLIGLSTHSAAQAQAAQATSANYLGLGPVFPSGTKAFSTSIGVETLRECQPLLERPTFAIGGIHTENVAQVHTTGIRRVAVQGALGPGRVSPTVVQQLRPQQ